MKKTLYEVDIENGVLTTMDGMVYHVNPSDLPTCCTWIPTAELEFETRNGRKLVTNLECDSTISLL